MRTTVVLPDHLMIEAKKLAADRRSSLTRVLEESLRAYLARERNAPRTTSIPPLPVVRSAKPRKGIDLTDTSALLDLE
jgi:hypothetical protein